MAAVRAGPRCCDARWQLVCSAGYRLPRLEMSLWCQYWHQTGGLRAMVGAVVPAPSSRIAGAWGGCGLGHGRRDAVGSDGADAAGQDGSGGRGTIAGKADCAASPGLAGGCSAEHEWKQAAGQAVTATGRDSASRTLRDRRFLGSRSPVRGEERPILYGQGLTPVATVRPRPRCGRCAPTREPPRSAAARRATGRCTRRCAVEWEKGPAQQSRRPRDWARRRARHP